MASTSPEMPFTFQIIAFARMGSPSTPWPALRSAFFAADQRERAPPSRILVMMSTLNLPPSHSSALPERR